MLELDEGQLSRPVLRGRGGSNTSLLPGRSVDGSSQRGWVCARSDPRWWGVRRGAKERDCLRKSGFPARRVDIRRIQVRLESLTYDKNCPHSELRDEKVPKEGTVQRRAFPDDNRDEQHQA